MKLNRRTFNFSGFWDKTGVAAAWLCAAHCLAMPFMVSFLPLVGLGFLAGEETEYVFIGLSISIASISLLPGFFKFHGKFNILLLFVSGLGLVIFSDALFGENPWGKTMFVLLGAGLISAAHFFNRRWCRSCQICAGTDCRPFG